MGDPDKTVEEPQIAAPEELTPEELDLDEESGDLDSVIEEAMAAVEEVESGRRPQPGEGGGEEELARLRREVEELRDRSTRTLADFDNYRKRTQREREEQQRYALAEPLRAFLEVVDNLERAVAAGGSAEDLKAGVEMILRQMHDLLRRHGVTPVAAQGEPFDPAFHEAVSREEDPDVEVPTVSDELQRGYRIHDRLLRPAKVRVTVPTEGQ